jgi:predicted negative regulator of RcsB-dependent stress response
MNRNTLYLLIGLLVIGLIVVGYLYYQESQSGVQIRIGDQGISIDGN